MKSQAGADSIALAILLLATGAAGTSAQGAGEGRVFAQIKPGNRVEIIDPVTGRSTEIYRSQRWSARGLSVSPTGTYLGLLEVDAGRVEGYRYREPPRSELILLDSSGRVIRRVARDVQRYVWCGDTCLAYIVGQFNEGGFGFLPGNAHLFDVATGNATRLPGPPSPIQLVWAPFDSSVYLKNAATVGEPTIYRYHMPTGTLSATRYRDLHFSSSGEFYLHYPDEVDDLFRLFDARSNRELRLPALVGLGTPVQWVSSGPNHLLLVRAQSVADSVVRVPTPRPRVLPIRPGGLDVDVEYAVYDVGGRRVVRTLRGRLPRWSAPPDVLPIISGGRISAISRQ